jgi:hypothetical protein
VVVPTTRCPTWITPEQILVTEPVVRKNPGRPQEQVWTLRVAVAIAGLLLALAVLAGTASNR